MSAEQMILTVLATKLAQAVAKDNDNPDGHDIASGLYGPAVSEWLREVAKELAPAEPVVLECKAGDLKALMRSHYERRPRAIDRTEPTPTAEYDVRTIMLDVVPGEDGHGHEVYAKSVDDVHAVLTRMGERIEELESRLAAPPAPARQEWQPIETAPKDQFILVSCPSGYTTIPRVSTIAIMRSKYKAGRWIDHANDDLTDWGMVPTHWQPRPADPAEGGV